MHARTLLGLEEGKSDESTFFGYQLSGGRLSLFFALLFTLLGVMAVFGIVNFIIEEIKLGREYTGRVPKRRVSPSQKLRHPPIDLGVFLPPEPPPDTAPNFRNRRRD
ncbi:hypothetical protein BKA01_007236 [Pseudonocardia eucalypti]|nr:hypothetical protein [Pseudonocardia eucalypti]